MNQSLMTADDYRVRSAKAKRERMRRHLLNSVFEVCALESSRDAAVVNKVVRHAQVSRGTFYKYFDSLDQAISELGVQLADEMTAGLMPVYGNLDTPIDRVATGFQTFLIRAAIEPQWGSFIAQMGLLGGEGLLDHEVRNEFEKGHENGDFALPSVEVAADLLMGATIEAIRRIINSKRGAAYIRMMTVLLLRSLGVSPARAEKVVARNFARLCLEAPGKIDWWKEIE